MVVEFSYVAIDHAGRRVTGQLSAAGAEAARRELRECFSSVLELKEIPVVASRPYRSDQEQVCLFFRRFATLMGAGIPLSRVLDFLVDSEQEGDFRKATDLFCREVLAGSRLSKAMAHPMLVRIFDPVSVRLVALGEETGALVVTFARISDLKERQLALARSLRSALIYPCVQAGMILGMGLLFVLALGPGDKSLFTYAGTQLPWPTRVLNGLSEFLRDPVAWLFLVINLVAVPLLIRHYLRTHARFRLRCHQALLELPILGATLRKMECARFLLVLGEGMKVGVPLPTLLPLARDACSNDFVRLELAQFVTRFAEGEELLEALQAVTVLPPMISAMMAVGLESGKVDRILASAAASMEEDVQLSLEQMTRLVEPILLMVAGALAGFLAVAALLPFMSLLSNL